MIQWGMWRRKREVSQTLEEPWQLFTDSSLHQDAGHGDGEKVNRFKKCLGDGAYDLVIDQMRGF